MKNDHARRITTMTVLECAVRQQQFSEEAFGPGERQFGIIDHLHKELAELADAPFDLEEWIDIIILGLDGAWRAGHSPYSIAETLERKMTKNENRKWPDWKTADRNKAIEHDRSQEE